MYGYYSNYRQAMVEHTDLNKLLLMAYADDHIGDIYYRGKDNIARIVGYYNAHTNEYKEIK